MKIKGFVITQAEYGKKFVGIKSPDTNLSMKFGMVFTSEEDARNYLAGVIKHIKKEISLGLRSKDNLNPDKELDFCVTECEMNIPEEKMLKRGWILPKYGK